jgi:CHAT domain-containing protein/Tfp pilus assembly protein PilF
VRKLQNYQIELLALLLCLVAPAAAQTNPESARRAAEQTVAEAARWQTQKTAEERRRAIALLQAALPLWRAAGDRHGEARTLFDLGQVWLSVGEKPQALSLLNEALQHWRALNDRWWEATTLNTLGNAYLSIGESQRALEAYQIALTLNRALKQRRGEAQVLSNLGLLYRSLGELTEAAAYHQQALALNRALGDRRLEAVALHNLGELYLALGEHHRALEVCQLALPLHKAVDDWIGAGHTLEHLGTLYVRLGQPQRALAYYQEALTLLQPLGARQMLATVFNGLGATYLALGQPQQAEESYNRALALARAVAAPGGESGALAGLARVARARGQLLQARAQIEAALAIINTQRTKVANRELRASHFALRRNHYEFYLDLLLRLHELEPGAGHAAAALAASEQARARSLLDLLGTEPEAALEATPLKQAELLALGEPGAALLEYVLGRDGSFLFVITRAGLHTYRLPPKAVIEALVQELRAALDWPSRRSFGRYVSAAQRLYRLLLAPAAGVLQACPRWLIAPDGALYLMPFEALLAEGQLPARADYRALDYLLKQRTISYVPSASVLASLRQRATAQPPFKTFLALADPSNALPRLQQTSREAAEIARLYQGAETLLLTRELASEEQVKQHPEIRRTRFLHFATHGRMDEAQPHTSGLLLAPSLAAKEDGLLQIAEVLELKLQAELVVLSACETGLGKTLSGEGVLGLTRAFLSAGARSVAVSLWQVGDAATAELMVDFYRQVNSLPDKAEALRHAKLSLLANGRYAHPYYWAAFVLTGETR